MAGRQAVVFSNLGIWHEFFLKLSKPAISKRWQLTKFAKDKNAKKGKMTNENHNYVLAKVYLPP